MKRLTKETILETLHELDSRLNSDTTIVLCGSSALLLQDFDFRATIDIDFACIPSENVRVSAMSIKSNILDFQAVGVVQLLEDFEDRLVNIEDNFKFLKVKVLSKKDWIVSKLTSPKLDDIYESGLVTLGELEEVKEDMNLYCGITPERAINDLNHCIRMLSITKEF